MTDKPHDVFDFRSKIADELVTYTNIKQELVITTVDKLKLCLIEHKDHLRSRREWIGPASLLVAFVTTLAVADFRTALGLDAATWKAMFLIAMLLTGGLTVLLLLRAGRSFKKRGLDPLIDKIADRHSGTGLYDNLIAQFMAGQQSFLETRERLADFKDDAGDEDGGEEDGDLGWYSE